MNRPLIASTIEYLSRYGFREIIINLHHEPASVREQIGDGSRYGVRISYSLEEPEILGTAGALDAVRDRLSGGTFAVINGKIITDLDLEAALETHRQRRALATLVLKKNRLREYFREVILNEEGHLTGFGAFPIANEASADPLMFTGIHLMEPEIFEYIPRGVFSDSVRDVYPCAIADGKTIAGHIGEGSWYELSTLERYLSISLDFLGRKVETGSLTMDAASTQRRKSAGPCSGSGSKSEPGRVCRSASLETMFASRPERHTTGRR